MGVVVITIVAVVVVVMVVMVVMVLWGEPAETDSQDRLAPNGSGRPCDQRADTDSHSHPAADALIPL